MFETFWFTPLNVAFGTLINRQNCEGDITNTCFEKMGDKFSISIKNGENHEKTAFFVVMATVKNRSGQPYLFLQKINLH